MKPPRLQCEPLPEQNCKVHYTDMSKIGRAMLDNSVAAICKVDCQEVFEISLGSIQNGAEFLVAVCDASDCSWDLE